MKEIIVIGGIVVTVLTILIIAIVSNIIENKRMSFVKENSVAIKKVMKLNNEYSFYVVQSVMKEDASCKSKRGFENFDVQKYFNQLMDSKYMYYERRIEQTEKNKIMYVEYLKKYEEIKSCFATKEQVEKLDFDFEIFNRYEKEIYESLIKKKPTMSFELHIYSYYTSPAGNSHYEYTYEYGYDGVKDAIMDAKQREYEREHVEELKRIREEEKRKKQQILKEKLKRADAVDKREEELYKKEKEFAAATQGHIYSATSNIATEIIEENNENEDLDTKLRKLKKSFDNGELTYNEYKEKREKLLEE